MIFKFKGHLLKSFQGIDFREMKNAPKIIEASDGFEVNVVDADIRLMKTLMNEDIVGRGLDNQNTVNDLGICLYEIYDEMLYQMGKR